MALLILREINNKKTHEKCPITMINFYPSSNVSFLGLLREPARIDSILYSNIIFYTKRTMSKLNGKNLPLLQQFLKL